MTRIQESLARLQKTKSSGCFLVLFFLLPLFISGQSLTITTGTSQPYGIYASTDFTLNSPGLARPGKSISLVMDDNRKERIISPFIQFTFNQNEIDQQAINSIYQLLKYRGAQAYRPWTQALLMGGARFTYRSENYELFGKAGLGMGWLSTFGYNIYSDSSGIIKFNVLHVNTFCGMAGIGANVFVRPAVSVCFGYDFFYARPNFGYEKFTSGAIPVKAAFEVEVKPPLTVGNLYAGVRFQFVRNKGRK